MKFKKYLFVLLSLVYLDLIFNLFSYDMYLRSSIFNIFFFDLVNAAFITLLISLFKAKANRIIACVIYAILGIWYSFHYIFYKVLLTPFSIALFRQSDQPLQFGGAIVTSIIQNLYMIILFLVPFALLLVFKKRIKFLKEKLKVKICYVVLFILTIGLFLGNIFIQDKGTGSIYNLYYETNNVGLNIERLGVMSATYLDLRKTIFGFDEKIEVVNLEEPEDNELYDYDYNNLELTFSNNNSNITKINDYIKSETGTKQNRYTGMFEGKNLIYIVAESFSEIGVSEELTPTLYKMIHEGFDFENFYTSNNLSTIGGEFQALTGLYADNMILTTWRGGWNYFPYGLGTTFKNLGYNTYAYHDNNAYFQDRHVYLKSQGFTNYKGCFTGLEKVMNCNQWPESDVEMMKATIGDYINSDKPFMTYYMTVSGHFYYTFSENAMARKHRDAVANLNYPEQVKAYVATQIELDQALKVLVDKLEEAGKLDDTVFVLLADHYPYNMTLENINKISTYQRDSLIEVNSNNLIIYNSKMKPVKVSKVGMSIDVIPTVFNLFGIEYDSRIIMGKDILSTSPGVAIFKNKSWVSDLGTYYAANGKFVAKVDDVPSDYVKNMNGLVNNRVAISRMIVQNNYYKYLFNK